MTDKSLGDLHFRRNLCRFVIGFLDKTDDPRRFDAMSHYKKQLAEIDEQITKLTGTPPPIVVGLKTAKLFGKAGLAKE